MEVQKQKQLALKRILPAIKYLPGALRTEAVDRLAEECHAPLPETLMLSKTQLSELRHDWHVHRRAYSKPPNSFQT